MENKLKNLKSTSTESGIAAGQSIKEREYWLKKMSGEWTKSHFYYDYSKSNDQDYLPETIKFTFSGEIFSRLQKIISGSDAKLYMILAAELVLLLEKYTGSVDIVVGSPIYRQKVEGEFINTVLPLRNRLTDNNENITFKSLLLQVRHTINEAVKNQNYPMDKLIYELNLPVSDGGFPLFDIVLLLENIHDRRYITHIPCSMTFSFLRTEDAVESTLEYDSLLYDRAAVERITAHLSNLLTRTLFDVDIPLSEVDVFTREEKKQLLIDFNSTDAAYPSDKTLHELFEEQVERAPDNIALIGMEHRVPAQNIQYISYRKLNQKANRLAHVLQDSGVKPNTIVGIMAEPSVEMIAAIFAVLKAGGAYLPIDPNYPEDRINYMLKDSGAKILLKSEIRNPKSDATLRSSSLRSTRTNSNVQNINDQNKNLGTPFVLNFENLNFDIVSDFEFRVSNLSSSNLAYVIYTSGSTGNPKGVLIEHRNILNYVWWRINSYKHTSSDICLQMVSFSFDGFCANFYPTLLSGGALVYLDERRWRNPDYIRSVIRMEGITHFSVVPSMFRVLLDGALEKDFESLRFVVLAGEKADGDLIIQSKRLLPGVELINEYGPTENAVTTTCCRDMKSDNTTVIGVPISNNRVFILDDHQQPKPLGVPGELWVSGASLARGYLNRPELTAEKFNHDFQDDHDDQDEKIKKKGSHHSSFITHHSALYRTGDLARWLPDGTIEILGRIDHQVQIRGFRVELEEIEKHLLDHHDIKEAVVIVKEGSGRGAGGSTLEYNYLCAYIVPHNEFNETELRTHLAKHLPDYMVPTYLIATTRMPLTSNGKIDRKKLSEMEISAEVESEYIAPRSKTQKKLAEIWKKFLERDRVGIKDNFFNIGGDSIKTIGLLSLINKAFNTDFELVDLYENETIERFAEKIDTHEKTAAHNKFNEAIREINARKEKILEDKTPDDGEIEDIYPMSDIEKGMIYYSLRDTTPTAYYNQIVYQLEYPEFDNKIFKNTFRLLVKKHPILRTGFNMGDFEEPVQIVYKEISLDRVIMHEDISHLDRIQQETHINAFLEKDRAQPFDIKRPESLWRVKTFLIDKNNIILIWMGHHALTDGWSSASLVTELNNLYLALKTNPNVVPESMKASYKDFIIEQWVEKKNNETIEFWKKELMGYKRLEFPKALKTNNKPHKIKDYTNNLGAPLLRRLTETVKKYNISVKNVCFGAYLYMLNLLSYENDIVVGLVTNNRPNCEDGDKVIGCFLNTIPVRMKIPAQIKYSDYIEQVEKKIVELKRYEKLSLFEIVRITGEETQDQNPFFDTLFNFVDFFVYHQLHRPGEKRSGSRKKERSTQLLIEGSGSINTIFNFDVNITLGHFFVSLSYSDSIIDDELASKCCRFFETFLNRFVHEPEGLLEKGDMLSAEEKQKLLVNFNRSEAVYPHDKTLHELFGIQVEKTPEHTAVVGSGAATGMALSLTYRELNKKSNQLGCELAKKGIKPDHIVGIMLNPSIEMIVGILGILKAGGAYLPIDPDYPQERIRYILADSAAKILLTTRILSEKITIKKEIIYFEDYKEKQGIHHSSLIIHHSDNLAYVIYTSGTTGRPKGVMVSHRNAVNTVTWFGQQYRVRPGIHLLMMSSYTFDASVNQVFGTLLHGASLYLLNPELLSDLYRLRQWIDEKQIHIINFVPAFLNDLLAEEDRLKSLQIVISGAEPLGESFKDKMLGKGYTLYNHYGPTETTIDALGCQCTRGIVTLGKPISNVQCFILDNRQALLPIGVPGELFISGAGVARGYLNKPELSAEKFNRSYRSHGSYVSYKSGDLARWLSNGEIEFLGRIDRQVKIRGFRIEVEEIENRLLEHPEIKESVVLTGSKKTSDNDLCAYIVPHHVDEAALGKPPTFLEELREFLLKTLPHYMVPTYFVPLEAIPLTPGGKIDRHALPEPGTYTFKEYAAPRSEIEETLVQTWTEILDVPDPIGIDDNFFELGGHSLKAMIFISKIHKKLDVKLPLAELFKNQTIRKLSAYIAGAAKETYAGIEPGEKKQYYDLSHAQKRLWILAQIEKEQVAYNIARAFEFKSLDREIFEKVIETLVKRHEILRTTFITVNGEPKQKIHDYDFLDFNVKYLDLRQDENPEKIIKTVKKEEEKNPFNLETGPLLKNRMLHIGQERYLFLFTMHHIISDAWSMDVMENEFTTLYDSFNKGKGNPLPLLRIQYRDYTQWHLNQLSGENLTKNQTYWLSQFNGEIPFLELPTDYPRPKLKSFVGAFIHFSLSREVTENLKRISKESGSTLFITCLAVVNVFLYRYTGQTDIIVGTPVSGREHKDLENQIGFYINMLALRNKLEKTQSFREILQTVKYNTLEAFEHQVYPFDQLVQELNITRDLSHNPLFDVVVTTVTEHYQPENIDDILESGLGTSKHDLRFRFIDQENQIAVHIQYNPELFKKERIMIIRERLIGLMTSIISNIDEKIDNLGFQTEFEKKQSKNKFKGGF